MYTQLQAEKQALLDRLAELESQEEDARKAAIAELCSSLDAQIEAAGLSDHLVVMYQSDYQRLLDGAGKTGQAKAARESKPRKPSIVWANPENPEQTYSKGPVPQWFKTMLAQNGVDVADKKAVAAFKQDRLQKLAA